MSLAARQDFETKMSTNLTPELKDLAVEIRGYAKNFDLDFFEVIFEMLDYDEAVMGIEIYNNYSARRNWLENPNYVAPEEDKGFSLNLWDRILRTGRRCWGFCVPDHSACGDGDWNGRSVLLDLPGGQGSGPSVRRAAGISTSAFPARFRLHQHQCWY